MDADIYNSAHDAFIEYFSSNQTIHQEALWFDAPISFIWLSNLPIWDVSDEGYSRNASCALICILTYSLAMLFRLYWYLAHAHFLFIWHQ
jgi:hypothetical protein